MNQIIYSDDSGCLVALLMSTAKIKAITEYMFLNYYCVELDAPSGHLFEGLKQAYLLSDKGSVNRARLRNGHCVCLICPTNHAVKGKWYTLPG